MLSLLRMMLLRTGEKYFRENRNEENKVHHQVEGGLYSESMWLHR